MVYVLCVIYKHRRTLCCVCAFIILCFRRKSGTTRRPHGFTVLLVSVMFDIVKLVVFGTAIDMVMC